MKSIISVLVASVFILLLVLPTIANNIDDPNMIVYFNADEGGQMDLIWSYYSGQKRDSFQWDFDYGLEMVYLADFARVAMSNFVQFTPGLFVLLLRWINLLSWIFSFFALSRLIKYHFGDEWQVVLVIALLAVRPALASLSKNMKPESLVLFFMIIGLDYTLRIVDSPLQRRNLYIAIAAAAVACLIKYAGIFLLPAIIAAMCCAKFYHRDASGNQSLFPEIRFSWIFPGLLGLVIITLPILAIFFYIRKSTGGSWYEAYGLWGSLIQNRLILTVVLTGLFLLALSGVISILNKSNNLTVKKIMTWINELNSYALFSGVIFFGFIVLLGFKFIIKPDYFLNIYAQLGPTSLTTVKVAAGSGKALLQLFISNIASVVKALDPAIVVSFIFYLIIEIYYGRQNFKAKKTPSLLFFKRLVLLSFLVFPIIIMLAMIRMEQHHMLPFFVVLAILTAQGIYLLQQLSLRGLIFKSASTALMGVIVTLSIAINAQQTIKLQVSQFRQREDIAFQIKDWWLKNIVSDAKIVTEHYNRVYIPQGYSNIRALNWNGMDKLLQLRQLIQAYQPQFVYYNEGSVSDGEEGLPPLTKILPGKNVRLIKSFDNSGRDYQKRPLARFVIYEVMD